MKYEKVWISGAFSTIPILVDLGDESLETFLVHAADDMVQ
jgi:hypothetical protein